MNVAIFTEAYPPVLNGVAVSVGTFARELSSWVDQVYVFAPAFQGYREPADNVFRFRSFGLPQVPNYPIAWPFSLTLFQRFRRLKIDLIHSHSPFLLGRMGACLARHYRLPFVYTYHTLLAEYVHYLPFSPHWTRKAAVRFSRNFCNRADVVIAPSDNVRKLLRDYGVTSPIAVIPTGISLTVDPGQRECWRRRWGATPATLVLLFVGRLAPEKNVELLLHAYARVQARHPETRLVLVGAGSGEKDYRGLAQRLGLSDHVHFAGAVPHPEIGGCYAAADLFAFPSVTETQGLSLGEAMAAGLPCVAARAYGTANTLRHGETGLLVEPDPERFAEALQTLVEDEALRRRLGQKAQQAIRACSPRESVRKLMAVYEHACTLRH